MVADPHILTLSQITGPAIRADWTPSAALSREHEVQCRADADATYTAMTVADTRDSAESGIVV